MEAVGYAQSEAQATAESVESAADFTDIIGDTNFDDIFAAASANKESQSGKEAPTGEEKIERELKKDEREQAREETKQHLLEHFGSQQFSYDNKYKGDVALMLAMCPAIDAILDEGFEYVSSWLEPHKVMEEKAKDSTETENDEREADDSSVESETNADSTAKPEPKANTKSEAEQSKPVKPEMEVLSEAPAAQKVSKQESAAVAASSGESTPSPDMVVAAAEIKADELVTVAVVSLSAQAERVDESMAETHEVLAQESLISVVQDVTPTVFLDTAEAEASTNEAPEVEIAQDIAEVSHEVLEVVMEAEDKEAAIDLSDIIEIAASEEITPSHFESWREIAQDELQLEELFITVADDLETNIVEDETDDEAVESAFISEHQEIADEELVFSNQPEVFAVYTAISSTRKSVEALYTARTKDECKFYIEQIVESLSIVLRALGYDNPEIIIRDFLATHSPEALKNLITELENSLRRTMVREIQHRRAGHAKNRHTRLSKFVGFVMQALAPKLGKVSESA